jgi:hypothetical protein
MIVVQNVLHEFNHVLPFLCKKTIVITFDSCGIWITTQNRTLLNTGCEFTSLEIVRRLPLRHWDFVWLPKKRIWSGFFGWYTPNNGKYQHSSLFCSGGATSAWLLSRMFCMNSTMCSLFFGVSWELMSCRWGDHRLCNLGKTNLK